MCRRAVVLGCWVAVALSTLGVAAVVCAQDLLVAGDDGHIWLVVETAGEDGEAVEVYHRRSGDDPGEMEALEPIPGRLRPGGITAGGGRLVLVMDSGDVVTRRPYLPPMGWGWAYRSGTLPRLPDGCGLRALLADGNTVWALVRVDDPVLLEELDAPPAERGLSDAARDRQNLLLGLPPGVEPAGGVRHRRETSDTPEDEAGDRDPAEGPASEGAAADDDPPEYPPADAAVVDPLVAEEGGVPEASPTVPAYRLVRVGGRGWRSATLPEGFGLPQQAALLHRDSVDRRPLIVSEARRYPGELVVWTPDADGWLRRAYRLPSRRGWSAASVAGQVVIGVERVRAADQVVVDAYLLRSGRSVWAGMLWLGTSDTARWRLLGLGGDALLLARPVPPLPVAEGQTPEPALMGEYRLSSTLFGETRPSVDDAPLGETVTYVPARRSRWEANGDWLIQIAALTGALVLLMLFWKRTPRSREVRLPKNVHLVPWSRRLISAAIDLAPGLWIAGVVYGLGWDEIVLRHWPGTPLPKPPSAMAPGWLVIVITVFHTTVFEFITARSIGKWLTGTYVSDFRGVPAPPGASTIRAVTRVFDMVAWMLLLLPLISPHRQRLGDILAKTLVVYRDPPEQDTEDAGQAD